MALLENEEEKKNSYLNTESKSTILDIKSRRKLLKIF